MSQFSFLDVVVVGLTLIALIIGVFQIISDYRELQKIKQKGEFRSKISEAKSNVLQHQ
jgi:hypothetical protein